MRSSFMRNLTSGTHTPVDRARMVVGNLMRRHWFGSRSQACCGNYGDPGC